MGELKRKIGNFFEQSKIGGKKQIFSRPTILELIRIILKERSLVDKKLSRSCHRNLNLMKVNM